MSYGILSHGCWVRIWKYKKGLEGVNRPLLKNSIAFNIIDFSKVCAESLKRKYEDYNFVGTWSR